MDILTYRLQQLAGRIDVRFDNIERRALPSGGSDGMLLAKSGPNPFDAEWRPGITVGPVPPSNPQVNQLWVDTN